MSDRADDQNPASAEAADTGEQPTAAWSEPAAGPRWAEIAGEAASTDAGGAGSAGEAAGAPAGSPAAAETGRSRRPSSLRSPAGSAPEIPHRRPTPPQFPKPGPGSSPPVSESPRAGRSGQVPNPVPTLLEKLPVDQLRALVRERPEVGLGIAFAGGLVIATIIRRLAR